MADREEPASDTVSDRRGGEQLTTGRTGGSFLLAIVIGAAGGTVFALLKLPLPWMLGAMVFVTVASIAGAPVRLPHMLRQCMVVFIGTMLGSQFTPELLDRVGEWMVSVGGLLVYGIAAMTLVLGYLRRFGGYDPVTAYFASAPGGLNDMTIIGRDMGGDDRVIALTQASRILLVVLTIPVLFQIFGGYEPPEGLIADGPGFGDLPLAEWGMLLGCALLGPALARACRLPAAFLLGPLLLSAATHIAGWSDASPPVVLVAAAPGRARNRGGMPVRRNRIHRGTPHPANLARFRLPPDLNRHRVRTAGRRTYRASLVRGYPGLRARRAGGDEPGRARHRPGRRLRGHPSPVPHRDDRVAGAARLQADPARLRGPRR